MAAIDQALLDARLKKQAEGKDTGGVSDLNTLIEENEPGPTTPAVIGAPPPPALTKEQKQERAAQLEAARLNDDYQKKLSKDQEAILKQQEALLGKEEADKLRAEQLQEANKAAAIKAGQKALKNAGQIVHGADVRVGAIPTPGSIITPLILLLLFFFILVQINGYSRVQWFWQVITGASRVGTSAATPAVTSVGGPGGTITVGQGGEQPFSPGVESAWFASDGTTSFRNPNGVYGSPF